MRTIKSIIIFLIIIIFFFTANFFYRRHSILGCWKEAFFLQQEGVCEEQAMEKMGFGKTFREKNAADQITGLIKENYKVTTLPAVNITSDSATLNAIVINSVNNIPPSGLYDFSYGESENKLVFSSNAYPFNNLGRYSIILNKLKPKTTYYYTGTINFNKSNNEKYPSERIKKSDIILSFTTL